MAAKPNQPPMQAMRKWIGALELGIENDDQAAIEEVLKEAVPEFGLGSAIGKSA